MMRYTTRKQKRKGMKELLFIDLSGLALAITGTSPEENKKNTGSIPVVRELASIL